MVCILYGCIISKLVRFTFVRHMGDLVPVLKWNVLSLHPNRNATHYATIDKATKSNNIKLQLNKMSTHIYFQLFDFNLINTYQFIVENLSSFIISVCVSTFYSPGWDFGVWTFFYETFFISPFPNSFRSLYFMVVAKKNRKIILRNCNTKLFPFFFPVLSNSRVTTLRMAKRIVW